MIPTQGSTKDSITAGACSQSIVVGSLTTWEVRYVRAMPAEMSLFRPVSLILMQA